MKTQKIITKLNILLLTCLVFNLSFNSFSQQKELRGIKANDIIKNSELIYLKDGNKIPTLVRFKNEKAPSINGFLTSINSLTKSTIELIEVSNNSDDLGFVHRKYVQKFDNKTVEFSTITLHTKNGRVILASGNLEEELIKRNAKITEKTALNKALNKIGASKYKWQIPEEEEFIKREKKDKNATFFPKGELLYLPTEIGLKLVYKFNIYASEPLSKGDYYVDATSGKVVFVNNQIHHSNSVGTANTGYSGTKTITTDSLSPVSYRLRETSRGNGIETYDMNTGTNYGSAVDFTDADNNWTSTTNQDQYAYDAHWGAGTTYDYFLAKHSRNSIDGFGFAIKSYVHYDVNYVNAFWDGSRMTYGDGDGVNTTALTCLDVVGHEITHGLVSNTANLVYSYESGALNESFADIFGIAIDFWARPSQANWLVGDEIYTNGTSFFRSMSNPNIAGDPDTYLGTNWHTSSTDHGGVHTNSGVQNYWFYLLTNGGSGTNDNSDTYSVSGIGMEKASKIAFRNLTVYLNSGSQYSDARAGAIQSAIDLYGYCSPEVEATINAWYAVGVGAAFSGFNASFLASQTTGCSIPFGINFYNTGLTGSSYLWDFGDGNTSTFSNVSHTYSSQGTFTVKLIVYGSGLCSNDTITKTNYITIDTNSICPTILTANTVTTSNACTGILYDDGGENFNYTDSQTSTFYLNSLSASSYTLNLDSFDLEPDSICSYDYLEIYDGTSLISPLIGKYCNLNPPPSSITTNSGAVRMVFYTDTYVNHNGFKISWNCNTSTCFSPAVLKAINISDTSATLSWLQASFMFNRIEYGFAGFSPGTGISKTSNISSLAINGLSPDTEYDYYVRAICSSDSSGLIGPFRFRTNCVSFVPTYSQDFYSFLPICWQKAYGNLVANTYLTTNNDQIWTATGYRNFGISGAVSSPLIGNYWLISPSIDLGNTNPYQAEFDLAITENYSTNISYLDGDDTLAFVISTDNGSTWSNANKLVEWNNSNQPSYSGKRIYVDLSAYSNHVKLAFYQKSIAGFSITSARVHIDNFLVTNLCVPSSDTSVVTICGQFTSPLGQVYYTSGIYSDSMQKVGGCDSIIVSDVTINLSKSDTLIQTVCDSFVSPAGKTLKYSGVYTDYFTAANGCDSNVVIILTVENNFIGDDSKYESLGMIGGSGLNDYINKTISDNNGNTYLLGYFQGTSDIDPTSGTFNVTSAGGFDGFLTKLDPNGNFLWGKVISGNAGVFPYEIFISDNNELLISGEFSSTTDFDPSASVNILTSLGNFDAFILKLNASGNFIWVKQFGAPGSGAGAFDVSTDGLGNVYSIGLFTNSLDFDPSTTSTFTLGSNGDFDVYVSKLSPAGNFVWAKSFGGVERDQPGGIAIDSKGDLCISGYFDETVDFDPNAGIHSITSNGERDIFVLKLDNLGNYKWVNTFGSANNESNRTVSLDATDNIYLSGYFPDTINVNTLSGPTSIISHGYDDAFVTKLSPLGDIDWIKNFGSTGYTRSFYSTSDPMGNVYVTGYYQYQVDFDPGPSTHYLPYGNSLEAFLSKFNTDGEFVWVKTIFDTDNYTLGDRVHVDKDNNVFLSGRFADSINIQIDSINNFEVSSGFYEGFFIKISQFTHSDTIAALVCDKYVSTSGKMWDTTGIYLDTIATANGCDSILYWDLTVNYSTSSTDVQTACDSYTWINGVIYTASTTTATDTLVNTVGCDSVITLNLTIKNSTSYTDVHVACNSFTWKGVTYTASNTTATDTAVNSVGCDSVIHLDLTINFTKTTTDTQTACDSFTWINGVTYTTSNTTAKDTLMSSAGCDSIVALNLTINYSTQGTDVVTACDSYIWIDGITYTVSNNIAQHTLTNAVGCDSVVTLNLTINNSTSSTDVQTACDSYTWINGVIYTASTTTATDTLVNTVGCDSVITLNLTIKNSTSYTDVHVACNSFTWKGVTYTASNTTATDTAVNSVGCDSVIHLDLTINFTKTTTDTQTACDSFTWINGVTYTTSNTTAKDTLMSSAGCDSIVALNLTINYSTQGTDVVTACDSYIWIDGITYTVSNNIAQHTLTNAVGCDSVVTLNLTINNSTSSTDVQTACDSYTWINGVIYTASTTTATDTLVNTVGCDSVITLNLTIKNSTSYTDVHVACNSFTWKGVTYTASNTTATDTAVNSVGCDSVIHLDLTINFTKTTTDTQTACDSFTWINGVTYTTSNTTAKDTLMSSAGCDSIVALNLTINYSTQGTDVVTACDSYIWIDGITYTVSNNIAQHTLTNAVGCDSVVTLNLTINNSSTYSYTDSICPGDTLFFGGTQILAVGTYYDTLTNSKLCDSIISMIVVRKASCPSTSVVSYMKEKINIVLFPNPTASYLTVSTDYSEKLIYIVYDVSGKIISEGSFTERTTLDLNQVANGVYVLQLKSKSGVKKNKRFIVSK